MESDILDNLIPIKSTSETPKQGQVIIRGVRNRLVAVSDWRRFKQILV